jgi:hypothetical protein
MMARTALMREIGGYWNHGLSEDWDMFLRMSERAELANINEVLLYVRMAKGSIQSSQMAEVRARVAYSCELARRRRQQRPLLAYEEFRDLRKSEPYWKRLHESLEVYARAQYRKAMGEVLGDRPWLGRARVAWAAACAPRMTWQRISGVVRHRWLARSPNTQRPSEMVLHAEARTDT